MHDQPRTQPFTGAQLGQRHALRAGGVVRHTGSSGHLRVEVESRGAKVDYVRSIVPGLTRAALENAHVEHSYAVRPRR